MGVGGNGPRSKREPVRLSGDVQDVKTVEREPGEEGRDRKGCAAAGRRSSADELADAQRKLAELEGDRRS